MAKKTSRFWRSKATKKKKSRKKVRRYVHKFFITDPYSKKTKVQFHTLTTKEAKKYSSELKSKGLKVFYVNAEIQTPRQKEKYYLSLTKPKYQEQAGL